MSNLLATSWREQLLYFDDDDVYFVQDQNAELDFYSTRSLKQQSPCRYSTWTHFSESEPTGICSYYLVLHA